jgi:hypothetical protein
MNKRELLLELLIFDCFGFSDLHSSIGLGFLVSKKLIDKR